MLNHSSNNTELDKSKSHDQAPSEGCEKHHSPIVRLKANEREVEQIIAEQEPTDNVI